MGTLARDIVNLMGSIVQERGMMTGTLVLISVQSKVAMTLTGMI
jgi:hypothetical protein